MAIAVLEVRQPLAERPVHRVAARFDVFRDDETVEALPDQLLLRVAEHGRPGRVDRADHVVQSDHQEQVARVPPDAVALPRALPDLCFQLAGRPPELLFGALLLVDVEHGDHAAGNLAGRVVPDRRPDRPDPDHAAIAAPVAVLAFRRLARGDGARQRVFGPLHPPPVRMEGGPLAVGVDVGRGDYRVPEDALDLRIAGDDAPGRRFGDDDPHRHRREHRPHPRFAVAEALLGLAAHVDVDHRADEAQERAVGAEARPGDVERPAVHAVGPAQPEL